MVERTLCCGQGYIGVGVVRVRASTCNRDRMSSVQRALLMLVLLLVLEFGQGWWRWRRYSWTCP